MGKMLPTERTLNWLRKEGVLVDKCERWIKAPNHPAGGIRKDLFGIIDLIAIRNGKIVGIQCSGISAIAAHRTKIEESPFTIPWLQAGALIEIWAFKKTLVGKSVRYQPKVEAIEIPS